MRRVQKHVVFSSDQAVAVTLWIMMAWAHEAATFSPILLATSAEANSGKTTLLSIVKFLVPRGLLCANPSPAVIYRMIEQWEPSIIVDEADTALVNNDALREVVNTGWSKGSTIPRCVGRDKETVRLFPTFIPKVLGMKERRLPDTTLSRTIIIEMRRKKLCDRVERFQYEDDPGLGELRQKALRWTNDNVAALKDANPRLMLAIADLAGGGWPERARDAAVKLSNASDVSSVKTRLLADIRTLFEEAGSEGLLSKTMVERLTADEQGFWVEYSRGKPLTQNRMAKMLGTFGIVSETVHPAGEPHGKGYKRARFKEAWEVYLPQKPSFPQDPLKRVNVQTAAAVGQVGLFKARKHSVPHASKKARLDYSHRHSHSRTFRKMVTTNDGVFKREEPCMKSPARHPGSRRAARRHGRDYDRA
jgi:hypothetical protein